MGPVTTFQLWVSHCGNLFVQKSKYMDGPRLFPIRQELLNFDYAGVAVEGEAFLGMAYYLYSGWTALDLIGVSALQEFLFI